MKNKRALEFLMRYANPKTAKPYKAMLKRLFEFIAAVGGPPEELVDFGKLIPCVAANGETLYYESMNREFVKAFALSRRDAGDTPGTYASHIRTFRMFCSFLHSVGDLPDNPASALPVPKIPTPERDDWIRLDEAKRMLAAAERTEFPERDVAMVLVLEVLGLRPSELAGLRVSDVDLEAKILFVEHQAKTIKVSLPLTPSLSKALRKYLEAPGSPKGRGDHLFVTEGRRRPLRSKTLGAHLRKISEAAGIERRVTPYQCRHSAATLYYLAGGTEVDIKHLLRHQHLKTGRRYTHGIDPSQPIAIRNRRSEQVLSSWVRRTLFNRSGEPSLSSQGR